MPRSWPSIFSMIILLAGLGVSVDAPTWAELSGEDVGWIQVTTPHFIVYSNSTDARTAFVVQTFEDFHSALERIFPGVAPDETRPTYVFVFTSTATFEPYDRRDSTGRPGGFGGFCAPGLLANYIAVNVMPRSHYKRLVYHEYVHHFLNREYPDLPLWVHEGLAEYLSTFSTHEGRATLGDPLDHHLETIRESRTVTPLSWTLGLSPASQSYSEASRAGPFYAYSWLLVHYALHDGNGRPLQPHELLTLREPGRPFEETLVERLRMNVAQLQVKLQEYGRKKAFGFSSLKLTAPVSGSTIKTSLASRASVLTRLGELLAFGHGDFERAAEHFRRALELEPDAADARAGLSYVLELDGHADLAARYSAEATELSPTDARVFLLRGRSLLDRFMRELQTAPDLGDESDTTVTEARRALQKSVLLDADLAEGYIGLGLTYYYGSDDPGPGIAALETARGLLPARMDAAAYLAALYARAGNLEQSDALLARIERQATDRRIVHQARQSIFHTKQGLVDAAKAEERFEEALRILETMVQQFVDPGVTQSLQHHMARIRTEMQRRERIDRYNRAITLTNERKLDEAFEVLVELESEVEDPELAAAVESLLEYLCAALHRPKP